jgi:phosphoribosylamine---glycine ligase
VRVLVIDTELMNLDFALRCAASGDEVRLYRYQSKGKVDRYGEGFSEIRLVSEWRDHMGWAKDGLIYVTGNFVHLYELDRYRHHGFRIFGPTAASARLEIDRSAGQELLKAAGIEVPNYETFPSLQAAREFAAKADRPMVHKPLGDEADKSLTYVPHDAADLVGWLDHQIRAGKKPKGEVMLQEKVDLLCEMGISGWFGPEGFLRDKWQICFEHKNLMPGEIGPATGEMGTLCQYVVDDPMAEMLTALESALQALGHRGDFAIGCGIDQKGRAWPFEFTVRTGYPAWYIQIASHRGSPSQWMRDLLDGKDSLKVSYDAAIGVVMGQPWLGVGPVRPPTDYLEGHEIKGVEAIGDAAHLVSVMWRNGEYQTTGEYVAVVTGLGKSIEKARTKTYASVEKLKFPNSIYRTDIGCKIADPAVLDKLHHFGYALNLKGS